MTRSEVLERLRAMKPWLQSRGVIRMRLFGSHARDEASPDSDVDLLVELARPMGLEFFGLQDEVSRRLGARVDLFTAGDLHRIVLREALAEGVDA